MKLFKRSPRVRPQCSPLSPADDLTITVIGFGRWQCLLIVLLSVIMIPLNMNMHSTVFYTPPHISYFCSYPKGVGYEKLPVQKWIQFSYPESERLSSEHGRYQNCFMYDLNYSNITNITRSINKTSVPIIPCKSFIFDDSVYGYTIIERWKLVCSYKSLAYLPEILFKAGVAIGNLLFGFLCDRFGRKKTLFISLAFQPIFGIITAASTFYTFFLIARFCFGIVLGGSGNISSILVLEIISNRWRTVGMGLFYLPSAIGVMLLPVIASLFQNYQKLEVALSLPSVLFLIFITFVPESPHWLLCVQKINKAEAILRVAAGLNGHPLESSFSIREIPHIGAEALELQTKNILQMCHYPQLRKTTALIFIAWSGIGFVYTFNFIFFCSLSSSLFHNVFIAGVLGLIASLVAIPIIWRFGHAKILSISICFAGLFTFLPIFFVEGPYTLDSPIMIMLMCSIYSSTIAVFTMLNYTARMFPTVMRGTGLGVSTFFGILGSMCAPPFVLHHFRSMPLSLLIATTIGCFIVCFCVLHLPHNNGRELPDTLQDAENFNKQVKPIRWTRQRHRASIFEERELRVIDLD